MEDMEQHLSLRTFLKTFIRYNAIEHAPRRVKALVEANIHPHTSLEPGSFNRAI